MKKIAIPIEKRQFIVFGSKTVMEILQGRKSALRITNRLSAVNENPEQWSFGHYTEDEGACFVRYENGDVNGDVLESLIVPFPWRIGKRLFVREKWDYVPVTAPILREGVRSCVDRQNQDMAFIYKAGCVKPVKWRWRHENNMPFRASRLSLEIVSFKVGHLQDITDDGAISEGMIIYAKYKNSPKFRFQHIWESKVNQVGWFRNPWCWTVEFKPVETQKTEIIQESPKIAPSVNIVETKDSDKPPCETNHLASIITPTRGIVLPPYASLRGRNHKREDKTMNEESKIMRTEEMDITEIAGRIAEWAERREIPIAKFVLKYPALGGRTTFRNIRDGRCENYDVGKWCANYRAVLLSLERMDGAGVIFDDLRMVRELHRAIESACRSWDINRVVILQGDPGTGKSTAARILSARYGERVVWMEASEAYNDKPGAFLGALLKALGSPKIPALTIDRLDLCEELLCGNRRCLIIDEAHHFGYRCLNTLKTLVNNTPGEFVLLAIPVLWQRIESKGAYLEARQISTNRLAERVKFVLGVGDVVEFLSCAIGDVDAEELRKVANQIRIDAQNSGNMSYLRELAREVERRKGRTAKDILEACERVRERR